MNPVHTLQSALALSLLHSLWQVAVLALLAASVLALLARRSAAERHAVGMLFMLAMAVAPLATFIWLVGQSSAGIAGPVASGAWPVLPVASMFQVPVPGVIAAPAWLPWLWCAGVLVMLARLVGGWWMVRSLDRQAFTSLPQPWMERADVLRRALGIRRQVAIRLLQGVGLPCSARAWRPVVWLPVSMLTRLDPDQIEALIAHELAHVRRLDWIWNGLQCAVEALLFYHPGVWWLSRRIRREREDACDDLAVAVCGDAIVLAEALATLERHRAPAHVLALSATGGALMHRVTRLLSSGRPARLRWGVPIGVMAVLCSGVLLAAQLKPSEKSPTGGNQSAPTAPTIPAEPGIDRGGTYVISETVGREQRSYRKSVSLSGKVSETYTVNGKAAPIDASVREWISSRVPPAPPLPPSPPSAAPVPPPAPAPHDLPSPPPAPAPPAAPAPPDLPPPPPAPAPAAPPQPPTPPTPPSLTQTAAYRAALQSAQNDRAVIAFVGSPLVGGPVVGASNLSRRRADLTFAVSGPKGTAHVRARGQLEAGAWRITMLELQGN